MGKAKDFLDAVRGYTQQPAGTRVPAQDRPPKMGTVDPAYTGTGPAKVKFDGEPAVSTKAYVCVNCSPAAGDRVVLIPVGKTLAIIGTIGSRAASGIGRNLMRNGRMRINQRAAASATSLASGAYFLDGFKSGSAANAVTWVTDAVRGQAITIPASKTVQQVVERADVPAGTYVLSWVGTATARVYNVGASAPAFAAGPVVVALDGTADVVVEFSGAGTVWLTQLERGTTPTAFEEMALADELRRCQRYFQAFGIGDVNLFNQYFNVALGSGNQLIMRGTIIPMRATPTINNSGGLTTVLFTYQNYSAGSAANRRVAMSGVSPLEFTGLYQSADNSGSTLAIGYAGATNAEVLWASAEL